MKQLTVSFKFIVLYWGLIRKPLKIYLKVLHFLKVSEMYPKLTWKSSISTLPFFIIYLLIPCLVAISSFKQHDLLVDKINLKAFSSLEIPTLGGKWK